MIVEIDLATPVSQSFRVQSLVSRMDCDPGETSTFRMKAEIPERSEYWEVGLIVGPSGTGKSQILRKAFPDFVDVSSFAWSGQSFLDDLPSDASVESVSRALAAAGLSSVPAWLVPYAHLSNGQQQRAAMARALLQSDAIVFDEFTSLLDRVVARTTCVAAAKAARR